MQFEKVDPRDMSTESNSPIFRVHFWSGNVGKEAAGPPAIHVDEFELHDANVVEALQWAENERMGRHFVLYLLTTDQSGERHIHQLAGEPPN